MIVPMHEDLRLIQRVVHEQVAKRLPGRFFRRIEFDAEMSTAQPVVEQRQLEAEQILVVRRQQSLVSGATILHDGKSAQRVFVQRVGGGCICLERVEIQC